MLPAADHARSSQQQQEDEQRFSSSTPDLYDVNGRVLASQPLDARTSKQRISLVDTPAKGVIAYQPQHQVVSQTPTPDPFDHAGGRPDGGRPPLGHTSGNAQQRNHHRARPEASLVGHDLTTLCFNGTAASSPAWGPIPESLVSHPGALGPSPVLSTARTFPSTRPSIQSLQLHRPQPLRHQQNAAGREKQQTSLVHNAVPSSLGVVEINPIYEWPQFLEYRRKQSEKGPDDRLGQKWPIERELAFIDGWFLSLIILLPWPYTPPPPPPA